MSTFDSDNSVAMMAYIMDKTVVWTRTLVGKRFGVEHDSSTFNRADLPWSYRILEPKAVITKDYKPERLNIYVGEDGLVTNVGFS